jgi:hypothetical protein
MNARMQLGDPGDASGVDMGAYEFGGSFCPWDCQSAPSGTVDVMDFLAMLGRWGQECVQCDFGVGAPGVGIEEFLDLLQWWGTCPLSSAPPPETIEEVVEDAGLDYPQDWNEFVGVMIDPEVSEAVKANYRCWMDHYLDCHRRPFCSECVWCQICPDSDPYGNHP